MFVGEFVHTIDSKARIAIPSKFRMKLMEGVVLTRGLDGSLVLYSKEEWLKIARKISSLPFSQADSRAFARLMLAGAYDQELDSQGRILIPDYLRKYASLSLEKRAVVLGLFNRIEIWDENKWLLYKDKTEKESNKISERIKELGI